jgi:phosphoserine phosphatase
MIEFHPMTAPTRFAAIDDLVNVTAAVLLPPSLIEHLQMLEMLCGTNHHLKRIAAFDLDNTLIIGDIGEAVLAQLLIDGASVGITWKEYLRLKKKSPREAFERAVSDMAALEVSTVHDATIRVLRKESPSLNVEGFEVLVPTPHPAMMRLIGILSSLDYEIWVISASNDISVKATASEWLRISPQRVFGIRSRVEKGKLWSELEQPVPIGRGKVELFKKFAGSSPPLISAGDSLQDLPLLSLTHPSGAAIWVGEDVSAFERAKIKGGAIPLQYFIPRNDWSAFEKESSGRR